MTKKIDCSPDTKEYAPLLRVKKIKGNLYLYEVTPSYNPVTKKRSQTSKYIRKVYPHEDLHNITRDPPPVPVEPPKLKEIKAFGDAYAFHSLVEEIGLEKILLKCFSQEDTHFLLLLTAYRLLCGDSLCHLSSWMETSDLLSFYPYEQSLSSSSISKTLHRIGCSIDEQSAHFFLHWSQKINREGESLLFDLTSFSSQARHMEELEMGYSKDHSPHPQLNMGLLVNQEQYLPLIYKVYPGSLKDVSLLSHMVQEAKLLGISSLRFILDRGFYSTYNLHHMIRHGFSFLLPLPRTASKLTKRIMKQHRKELDSPLRAVLVKGKPIFAVGGWIELPQLLPLLEMEEIESSSGSMYYGLFLDPQRQAQESNTFVTELLLTEQTLQSIDLSLYTNKQHMLKEIASKWAPYFTIEEDPLDPSTLRICKNTKAIQDRMQSMGTFILLSSTELDLVSMLTQYRQRDAVEKVFDAGKNECFGNPLRVHSTETMKGTLFILFLTLILQTYLGGKMKTSKIDASYSIRGLFQELHKLKKAIWQGKTCLLNEITKAQRIIFQKLQIVLPNS